MSEQQNIERPGAEQRNVEVIEGMYAAFNRGDVPHIIAQLHDNARWFSHVDPIVPTSGDWSGKARVPAFFRAIADNMEVTSFTPKEIVAQGDTVVSMGDFGCKVKATGKTVLTSWIFIWKMRDGKVASYEQFHDFKIAAAFR